MTRRMRAVSFLILGVLALIALSMGMLVWALQPSTKASVNEARAAMSPENGQSEEAAQGSSEAKATAVAAVKIMTTFDPARDDNATQTAMRASQYMSPALVEQLKEQKDLPNADSGTWIRVAKHGAIARPRVKIEDGGADHAEGHSELILRATWIWKGDKGFEEAYDMTRIFTLQMDHDGSGWKVSDYTYKDIPGGAE